MSTNFESLLAQVEAQYAALCRARPRKIYEKPYRKHIPDEPGVYVLNEGQNAVYAGRTGPKSGLRKRLGQHTLEGSDPRQAALAKHLAEEELEQKRIGPITKDELNRTEEFCTAKKRVRAMCVRWVVEPDADCRYLLEFYAAKELRTRSNDFRET